MTEDALGRGVRIDRLGAKGDGVADTDAGPVYLPFTLPGETVELPAGGAIPIVVEPSPARVEPPCPHFTTCGGCDLQHADAATYQAFKHGLVVDALAREEVQAPVAELVPCRPGTRRRLALTAAREDGGVRLGFNERQSNRIVDVMTCPVALPVLQKALPGLRELSAIVLSGKKPARVTVTATATGLDVAFEKAGRLSPSQRARATAKAVALDIARLTVDGETTVQPRLPMIRFADAAVELPPGAFVQAVKAAEGKMAELVQAHLAGAKKVADLFAGCGTFALRLSAESAVHAVEMEEAPLRALYAAWRRRPGLKPLTIEKRDLFRRPLTAKDLRFYDAVVFDPPRAGAEAVATEIAASRVSRVAAVSCNPVTLARDLKILSAGGFRISSVVPVDQFLWSHHIEAVALLER